MKIIQKALRLIVLLLVLAMASVGLAMGGAILPSSYRKDEFLPDIELVEGQEEEELEKK
ncbi:hypothetical protein [Marinoscillum sp.]|uniref:hypothetical protein n=1 Tax=Marinoscillum sp. TaxID=2024838 RepID=UPI003BA8D521